MLEEQLEKFGLSEKEAKTYMTLLVLGTSPVTVIAEKSGVNRSSAYVVLEALQKKGLVQALDDDKIQKFRAAPPEKLAQIAEERLRQHEEIHKTVTRIIPELKGVDKHNKFRPVIRVLEGKESLKQAFTSTLETKEKVVRVASAIKNLSKILPPTYVAKYIKKRHERNIKMYGIHPSDKVAKILLPISKLGDDEIVLLPKKEYKFPVDLAVWDDKVGFMSGENDGYAIEIQSAEIAEVVKNIYDLAFAAAKKQH